MVEDPDNDDRVEIHDLGEVLQVQMVVQADKAEDRKADVKNLENLIECMAEDAGGLNCDSKPMHRRTVNADVSTALTCCL